MKMWKILGLAGVVGVAATGALVARNQRVRAAYEPDEVRTRLHARHAQAATAPAASTVSADAETTTRLRRLKHRLSFER